MGSITKRNTSGGQPRYKAVVRPYGRPAITKTLSTKKAARAWIKEVERAIEDGRFSPGAIGERRTVGDIIDLHIEEKVCRTLLNGEVEPIMKSWKDTRNRLIRWRKAISNVRANKCTDDILYETLVSWEVAGSSWNNYRNVMSSAFNTARKKPHGWIGHNPMDTIPRQKSGARSRVMYRREYELMLAAAQQMSEDQADNPRAREHGLPLYLRFLYETACRRSEALGALLENFDRELCRIRFIDTKNGRPRDTYISEELARDLDALPRPDDATHIFPGRFTGKPTSFDDLWRDMRDKAGIEPDHNGETLGQHVVRHTAITEAADGGATLTDIMAMSGHISEQTARKYIHTDQTAIRRAQELRRAR